MAGTKAGGQSAAETNKKKYGEDFYARIGAMGGKKGRTGGLYANRELAHIAGAKGGRMSRRGKAKAVIANGDFDQYWQYHQQQELRRNHLDRYQELDLAA